MSYTTTKNSILHETLYVSEKTDINLTYVYTLVAFLLSILGILTIAFVYYRFKGKKVVDKASGTISVQSWEWTGTGTPIVLDSQWISTSRSSSEIGSSSFISCSSSLEKHSKD